MSEPAKAKLEIMGAITVLEPDGDKFHYPMALLVTFSDPEAIRKAIAEGACTFSFQ